MTDHASGPDQVAAPSRPAVVAGAGTLALLALAWLLATLSSARQSLGDSPDAAPLSVTRAALELPQVIAASLIAGTAVGLAAVNVVARGGRSVGSITRLGTSASAGALTGLAVAAPIAIGYRQLPTILVLAGTVAVAAALGGLLAGVPHRAVVGAGVAGSLGVFAVGFVVGVFDGDLRTLFGAGTSPESILVANGWVVLTGSLIAGTVAGVLAYAYLRRCGPAGQRWPGHLVAGALPGLLALLAEAVTRLGGAPLFQLVSRVSGDDQAVQRYLSVTRFNQALIVLFVGALVAIFLVGRTLPGADRDQPDRGDTGGSDDDDDGVRAAAGVDGADHDPDRTGTDHDDACDAAGAAVATAATEVGGVPGRRQPINRSSSEESNHSSS